MAKFKNLGMQEWRETLSVALQEQKKERKKLNISFLGDSIFTYDGYIPTGNLKYFPNTALTSVNDMAFKKLVDKWGTLFVNNSWGGSRITSSRVDITPSITRAENLAKDGVAPDVIIIPQSINDYFGGVPLYESELGATEDPMRCYQYSYKKILEKLKTLYPSAKIFCCSMGRFKLGGVNTAIAIPNKNGKTPEQFNDETRKIAEQFGCTYVDFYNIGVTQENIATMYAGNDVHPAVSGQQLLFEALDKALTLKFQ